MTYTAYGKSYQLFVVSFFLIVFVDMAERKITVQYAKQIKGRKMYGGQSSYIPMKINASGVMPIIFASAIITFPTLSMSLFGLNAESGGFAGFWFKYLGTGSVVYSILTAVFILFFAYCYAQIQFNPADFKNKKESSEVAENTKLLFGVFSYSFSYKND